MVGLFKRESTVWPAPPGVAAVARALCSEPNWQGDSATLREEFIRLPLNLVTTLAALPRIGFMVTIRVQSLEMFHAHEPCERCAEFMPLNRQPVERI